MRGRECIVRGREGNIPAHYRGESAFNCRLRKANFLLLQTLNPHSLPSQIGSLCGVQFSNVSAYWAYYNVEQCRLNKVSMQLSDWLLEPSQNSYKLHFWTFRTTFLQNFISRCISYLSISKVISTLYRPTLNVLQLI